MPDKFTHAQTEPSAVLDEAHLGDIRGALGTIRQHDSDVRRTWTHAAQAAIPAR